ncbi:MAG TPA: hypothetical protein VHB98_17750, partial [Chloroflexota bacterium]|nr:hypothetical protein [Chloroflexota bacterium]
GHAHAAGFSIDPIHLSAFESSFRRALSAHPHRSWLDVDAVVAWRDLDLSGEPTAGMLALLRRLAPFCEGNPPPVFASYGLRVHGQRRFGAQGRHLLITLADAAGYRRDLKWWRHDPEWHHAGLIDVAYTITRDDWQGSTALQLTVRGIRPHQGRL